MPDVVQIRLKIGGVDYGQAGSPRLLIPGGRITAGDLTHIGDATINLEGGPGVDAGILNQAYVEWYLWNVTQNRIPAKGRWFCGWVAARETGQNPGTTEKTWSLPCQDINLLWEALVAKAAWAQGIHLAAGTFAAQIAALFAAFGTGLATRQVDATSQVLNLTGSAILPPCDFTGPMLRDMIGVLFANARKVNPLLRPTACLTPDPTIGAVGSDTFGSPVLWVWDLAHPPAPGQQYTTGTPDSTHAAILPERPVQRRLTSARFANWGQAQTPTGRVYTSAHAASVATYPGNPYDPDGVWKRPAYRDTQHTGPTANATGTATVAGGAVTGVTMGLNGTGYTEAPLVVFGGPGTGAAGVANMGGYLLRLDVTAQGTGYTSAPTVGFSGGGGTGAAATATFDATSGTVTALTITNPGTGYTSAPTISLTGGGGGSGAAATATIGGKVLSVTMLTGGTGYSSAPSVTFADAIQAALDAQVEQGALPRETVPISSRTPTLAGTYAGLTLTLEGGLVEVAYPVASLELDLTRPQDPIYTMQCGSRTLRLGESPGTADTFAPPVEGVRLSPPANFAQTNAFQRYVGNTRVTYTFDAPTPPPGVILDHYELHVLVDTRWYVTSYPGSSPGVILNDVNPGSTLQAYLVAVGRAGGRLIESFPTPTLGPFTVASAYLPDAPTALTLLARGLGGGAIDRPAPSVAWARIGFTPPGTANGPHDYYIVRWAASGEPTQSNRLTGTDTSAVISGTPGVTYAVTIQTYSDPAWAGGAGAIAVAMLAVGNLGGGGSPTSDQPLFPYSKSSGTGTPTVDTSDPFDGSSAYKFTSAGVDTQVLAGLPFATVEGRTWIVRTAAKKSGGSPTFAGTVQWSTDGTTWNVLTASALTLPALTTAWPASYTEQQVQAPTTANFGRLVYTATFAAALTILTALPQPTPASSVTDLKLLTASGNPIALYDSTGALRGSIYADGNAPDLIHLHSVTTGGVNSGWVLDSTYGDNLQVGDAAANGGISLVPASGKLLTLSGSGEKLIIQSIVETRGSSNPGSPATGDRNYRTDLHVWTYYDGARWLSEQDVEVGAWTYYVGATVGAELTTTQEYMNTEMRDDYAYRITRFRIQGYVNGTNNIANNWSVTLRSFTGLTTLATLGTSSWTGATWTAGNTTSFSAHPSLGEGLQLYVTKTGAPGPFRFYFKVYARLVIT